MHTRKRTSRVSDPKSPLTPVRSWWDVDVSETRIIRVRATGPKHAQHIAATVLADCYPQTSFMGEPDVIRSIAHHTKVIGARTPSKLQKRVSRDG
jgi:hypothetical protein